MKLGRTVALGLAVAACGGDEGGDGTRNGAIKQAPFALCDGSDSVRLSLITGGGGPLPDTAAFTNPHGSRFLHIDGRCNFVASSDVSGQILTGTFSAEQGKTITDVLGLERVAGVLYRFESICPDAPTDSLTMPGTHVSSGCGDNHAPAEIVTALNWNSTFGLAKQVGQPASGSVSVLVQAVEGALPGAVAWPFSFPIAQATLPPEGYVSYEDVPDHAKSLTGADATLARQVWADARARTPTLSLVSVTHEGKSYVLYVRDDLEPAFASKIAAAQNHAIARCDEDRVLPNALSNAGVYGGYAQAALPQGAPCGAELCWAGTFNESAPVQTSISLQSPAQARRCLGAPPSTVSADLRPLVDEFRASYPRVPVEIDLGFGMLYDEQGDDAICRPLSVEACELDPRCAPVIGNLEDTARQCSVVGAKLGCGAKIKICGEALTRAKAPDGRHAVFATACIPHGWTSARGDAPNFAGQLCEP